MTTIPPNVSAIHAVPLDPPAPPPMTGTEAVALIRQWTDLTPGKIAKFRSAVATAACLHTPGVGKEAALERLSMDCPTLSQVLRDARRTARPSKERLYSLASELRPVMRRLGRHEPDHRGQAPASPDLRALLQALPEQQQPALIDFFRFCDTKAIARDRIDSAVLLAFHHRCEQQTICRDAGQRARQVATVWNWAAKNVPEWPDVPLEFSRRCNVYTLPILSYPVSFQEDLERYKARLAGQAIDQMLSDDVFLEEGDGPARHRRLLRPATIQWKENALRAAAAALVHTGMSPDDIKLLRDLVQPVARVRTILEFHLQRKEGARTHTAWRIAESLRLLARDYCQIPKDDLNQISTLGQRE